MATLNFDANTVEPNVAFDPVPAGKYIAVIIDSEIKPTKSGNGQFLELVFEITEGEYKGRKVWDRLNIDNPNQKTVEIARGNLSAICRAVNIMQPQDSVDLHNLPLEINVKCKRNKETGDLSNEVKGYAAKENAAAPQQTQQQNAPWKR